MNARADRDGRQCRSSDRYQDGAEDERWDREEEEHRAEQRINTTDKEVPFRGTENLFKTQLQQDGDSFPAQIGENEDM